ncbi:hypothetical protein GWI34_18495 [Actinomadura sp. DSM 109109]|nr:hypothetical protein [Actinomadura lepetitiana]
MAFGRELVDRLSGANEDEAAHAARVLLRYVTGDSLADVIETALKQGSEALGTKVRIVRFGPKDAQSMTDGVLMETEWAHSSEPASVVSHMTTVDTYYVSEIVVAAVEGAEAGS